MVWMEEKKQSEKQNYIVNYPFVNYHFVDKHTHTHMSYQIKFDCINFNFQNILVKIIDNYLLSIYNCYRLKTIKNYIVKLVKKKFLFENLYW